jgi:hypothetical protein
MAKKESDKILPNCLQSFEIILEPEGIWFADLGMDLSCSSLLICSLLVGIGAWLMGWPWWGVLIAAVIGGFAIGSLIAGAWSNRQHNHIERLQREGLLFGHGRSIFVPREAVESAIAAGQGATQGVWTVIISYGNAAISENTLVDFNYQRLQSFIGKYLEKPDWRPLTFDELGDRQQALLPDIFTLGVRKEGGSYSVLLKVPQGKPVTIATPSRCCVCGADKAERELNVAYFKQLPPDSWLESFDKWLIRLFSIIGLLISLMLGAVVKYFLRKSQAKRMLKLHCCPKCGWIVRPRLRPGHIWALAVLSPIVFLSGIEAGIGMEAGDWSRLFGERFLIPGWLGLIAAPFIVVALLAAALGRRRAKLHANRYFSAEVNDDDSALEIRSSSLEWMQELGAMQAGTSDENLT